MNIVDISNRKTKREVSATDSEAESRAKRSSHEAVKSIDTALMPNIQYSKIDNTKDT